MAGALEGMTFHCEYGRRRKPEGTDTISFAADKFRSTACDAYGFGEVPYTSVVQGSAIAFQARTSSPAEGNIHWMGIVSSDTLDAKFMWTRGRKTTEYWLKGNLKK